MGAHVDLDMSEVASEAATVMRGLIPQRTGRARRSTRPTSDEQRRAGVEVDVDYVWPLNARVRFVQRTEDVMTDRLTPLLENEWDRIVERHQL